MQYGRHYNVRVTPQSEPIPGVGQVANHAGGFAWASDDWQRLDRFLILGTEGGTYYQREKALTIENAECVRRCLAADGARTVARIVEISDGGRAAKNDPAIFALAMAAGLGDPETKALALAALPRVCRIGTHLFHFVAAVRGFRGWGRGLRRAIRAWYAREPEWLAYQAVKYQQRDGWSHRDLLRLAKPVPPSAEHQRIYRWIAKKDQESLPALLDAFERAQQATTAQEIVRLIADAGLPREAIPTRWLTDAHVWEALLASMPLTAMIRNLATMTRVGLIAPMSAAVATITAELGNAERLHKSRVHPVAVLAALVTYAQGHGQRSDATWTPVAPIIDALDRAFYASFTNVETTGKRFVLACDVSASMSWGSGVTGVPGLTPRVATGALALVTAAREPNHAIMAFATSFVPLTISPRQRLDDVVKAMASLQMGGTDCSLPMQWARANKIGADVFVVLTDNETWAGSMHPSQALVQYRQATGINAKLAVVGMTATDITIADPRDAGMMDFVGFDAATPQAISEFAR